MRTLQDIYGVATIGVFGSVIREEDTPESDVDVLVTYRPGYVTMQNVMALTRYLEELFGRNVDLVSEKWLSPYLRPYIEAEVVEICVSKEITVGAGSDQRKDKHFPVYAVDEYPVRLNVAFTKI